MISWALWQQCNKFLLHQRVDRIDQVGVKAWCYLVEFVKANEKAPPSLTPTPVTHRKPPITSLYKINYVGTVFAEINEGRIGVIVRNAQGLVMASLVQKI